MAGVDVNVHSPIHPALNYELAPRCNERWMYLDGTYGERCVLAGAHDLPHLAIYTGTFRTWKTVSDADDGTITRTSEAE
jgi:hypothetical protein